MIITPFLVFPKAFTTETNVILEGKNTNRGQAVFETVFAIIVALIIGVALASTPSELQPAGILIIIVGIVILIAFIYSLIVGGG